jgi:hypothetical protein
MKNVYFSHGTTSEQRLYEDLIIESLKIYGHDVYYLPREIVNKDNLYTEDVLSKFDENYLIEMYLADVQGFGGDGSLLTKFGVRIAEEATFIISKRRWEDLISSSNNLISSFRPNEGDVVYFPLTNQLFQIKFVEQNKPFRQLNQITTYQLICEVMEYADERFETGIDEIDNIRREEGYSITFNLTNGIKQINVLTGGSGYTSRGTTVDVVDINIGIVPGSVGAEAVATVSNGIITGINIIQPGSGYSTVPAININGTGSGATASAILPTKGTYRMNEIVTGSISGATGKVIRYDVQNRQLELVDIVGTFKDNECLLGSDSNAEWVIDTFSSIENQNDDFNENKWFEDEGDAIVDWSEKNPFGEYTNMGVF